MKNRGLSQEWLKIIACVTMLMDHMGAVLLPQYVWLRIVGRIAFPIYCFLLAEGVYLTKNPRQYGYRLLVGAVLAEIPFDVALYGALTLKSQSIMLTLLTGFLMALCMKHTRRVEVKLLLIIPFAMAAELLRTDYGGMGVVLIGLFVLTRNQTWAQPVQAVGMTVIFWWMDSFRIRIGAFSVPIEIFALLSLAPIMLYSGKKASKSKLLQWGFYLFYPVHLTVLHLISRFDW